MCQIIGDCALQAPASRSGAWGAASESPAAPVKPAPGPALLQFHPHRFPVTAPGRPGPRSARHTSATTPRRPPLSIARRLVAEQSDHISSCLGTLAGGWPGHARRRCWGNHSSTRPSPGPALRWPRTRHRVDTLPQPARPALTAGRAVRPWRGNRGGSGSCPASRCCSASWRCPVAHAHRVRLLRRRSIWGCSSAAMPTTCAQLCAAWPRKVLGLLPLPTALRTCDHGRRHL